MGVLTHGIYIEGIKRDLKQWKMSKEGNYRGKGKH